MRAHTQAGRRGDGDKRKHFVHLGRGSVPSWPGPDVSDTINNWVGGGGNGGAAHVFYASVHMGVLAYVGVCVREGQNKLMADFSPCFDGIKSPLLLNVPR